MRWFAILLSSFWLISHSVFGTSTEEPKKSFELAAKFNFGNHWGTTNNPFFDRWTPLFGGQLGLEYPVFSHFSFEGGIRSQTFSTKIFTRSFAEVETKRAITFGPFFSGKFIWPISFDSQRLVPFLGLTLSLPCMSVVERRFSMGVGSDLVIGLKYFFWENMGVSLETGTEAVARKHDPGFFFFNYKLASGIIIVL